MLYIYIYIHISPTLSPADSQHADWPSDRVSAARVAGLLKLTWDSALKVGCPPALLETCCRRAEPQVRFKKMAEVYLFSLRNTSNPNA